VHRAGKRSVSAFLHFGAMPLSVSSLIAESFFERCAHAAQDTRRFGELDIFVGNDLDAVAPRVAEIEKRSGKGFDTRIDQCFASGFLVIDDKSKMTSIVGGLGAAPLERQELVSQIDERHGIAFASKRKLEEPTVESQSRFDVADLEGDMIESDDASLPCCGHGTLLF
jgi:hypothetical protein